MTNFKKHYRTFGGKRYRLLAMDSHEGPLLNLRKYYLTHGYQYFHIVHARKTYQEKGYRYEMYGSKT